jgi:hypothetical protein
VGLVAASPAVAAEKSSPKAKAAGGDVVELTYPSLVQKRVDRTQRALERATTTIEDGADATATLKVVRRQMAAAWRGAKYIVRTTPPAPPEEAAVEARASGDGPVGPTYAGPAETGVYVLGLQHDVASSMLQLVDGAHGAGLNAISTTLYLTLDRRDQAIKDIQALAPPAPPEEDAVEAQASQEEDAAPPTFDLLMPNIPPQLDDEVQAIQGLESDATDVTAGGLRLLNGAETQITQTKTTINTIWPPVPPED